MIIPTSETLPEWSSSDAAILSAFIASDTGQKLLTLLSDAAPSLLDGTNMNQTLVASGEVKGYTLAVGTLLSLRHTRPAEATGAPPNYPSLDDDSAWEDVSNTTQPTTPKQ